MCLGVTDRFLMGRGGLTASCEDALTWLQCAASGVLRMAHTVSHACFGLAVAGPISLNDRLTLLHKAVAGVRRSRVVCSSTQAWTKHMLPTVRLVRSLATGI